MDTYVFASHKGGVGKTTVTLGIAAALASRRVLLIDLDPQASATKVLGLHSQEHCSIADVMLEPHRYTLGEPITETDWGFDASHLRRRSRRGRRGDRRPTSSSSVSNSRASTLTK